MRLRQRCNDPRDPRFPHRGEGIFSMIILVAVTDLCSGIIGEVIVPKIKRFFGEEDKGCCGPPQDDQRS